MLVTTSPARILIVRLGALGDVVHAMPVVAAIKRALPAAQVDWLIDPRYAAVVRMVRGLGDAIPFDPRGLLRGGDRAATMATLRSIRGRDYDAVLDLQGLLKSAVVARLVGGKRTIGFARQQLREPLARLFYSDAIDTSATTHIIEKNLAVLGALGMTTTTPEFPLDLPPSAAAAEVQARMGGQGFVVLNPGAAWPNKRWPADRFGALAASVRARTGMRSLVLWGPGEEALADNVVAHSDGAAERSPRTGILDLFAVTHAARLVVSGDTGPLHIAAAVGTPVVALFGPTFPERNGPWQAADISLSEASRCECHYQRTCRRAVPCIDAITGDAVLDAVTRRLAHVS